MKNGFVQQFSEILKMGQEGKFSDYVAAEQAVMAVDLLLQANGSREHSEAWLDRLYATVENQDKYNEEELEF